MIGPCRCEAGYFCVSCKVKRGDYRDWMDQPKPPVQSAVISHVPTFVFCVECGAQCAVGPRCKRCANRTISREYWARRRRNKTTPLGMLSRES